MEHTDLAAEPVLTRPQLRELQLHKLKLQLAKLYAIKPFWRDRMDKAGLVPERLASLEEFSQRMPIMDKAERRALIEQCGGDPMAMADLTIGAPIEDVVLMAATSGTTGDPTPYPHTQRDLDINQILFARVARRVGIGRGDRILHAFGLSMWLAGVPYVQYLQKSGACVLPVGAESGSERILKFAQQFKVDTLFATPSLAEHLIEKAPDVIGAPISSIGIKRIICAGEPGAGIPEIRNRIETAYGAKLFDHGGSHGVSCDHAEYQGMHHFAEDYVYVELVDPETMEPVPFENGARGMPVQTTLEHEGMLWVRETFGDIFEIHTDPCPCGRGGFRYRVIGRADDMLKVKGVMVYPAAIDGVVNSFVPHVTGEFRIVLTEQPPRVVPPLKLEIEHGETVRDGDLDALAAEIKSAMQGRLRLMPDITWLRPNSLERATGKTKFFDKRY